MMRTPLPPRSSATRKAPAFRLLRGAVPACLLAGALLAAGCGEDNQSVPEHFASGARPAPVPAADVAAPPAELPPAPPAEPVVQPPPPAVSPAAATPEQGRAPAAAAAPSTPGKP